MLNGVKIATAALAMLSLPGAMHSAAAGSPYGIWQRPATGVIVQIFRCGGGVGVKVVKSSVPERIGKVYMCGAKEGSNGTFTGQLKNPEDNGIYSGHARLIGARQMQLSGCIPNTVLCRSEVWRRVK
jgi:uncharacterized protein (DUF2147 family)